MTKAMIALMLACALSACTGTIGAGQPQGVPVPGGETSDGGPGNTGSGDGGPECPPPPGSNSLTEQVRVGLARNCAGCHSIGQNGYFASLGAFETLLVSDTRLVRPGRPDESELVQLLEGRRTGGSLRQMPLSGDSFAVLESRGETDIGMALVREWITQLEAPRVDTRPSASAATVRRISATHVELGLRDLLGLSFDDFFGPAYNHGILEALGRSEDSFYLRSPDRSPGTWGTVSRYLALGGGAAMTTNHEDRTVSTSFVQTLVPVAQAWCGMAVGKANNTQLFTVTTPATGLADRAKLREQVADWYLMFLATRPSAAEIDEVVDNVFAPLEMSEGISTAWVGTCSHFIRHPLFIFY